MGKIEVGNFPLILLSAGFSERMGVSKGLVDFQGRPWISEQLQRISAAGIRRTVVVLGMQASEYLAKVPELSMEPGISHVLNPKPELGQFSSFQVGVAEVLKDKSAQAVFVLPIDVPAAKADVWSTLAGVISGNTQAALPEFRGRGGHPILLSRALLEKLVKLDPHDPQSRMDAQIKDLPAGALARIEAADEQIVMNLNTPELWKRFTGS